MSLMDSKVRAGNMARYMDKPCEEASGGNGAWGGKTYGAV